MTCLPSRSATVRPSVLSDHPTVLSDRQGIQLIAKFMAALFFAEIKIKSWQLASSASRQSHDLFFYFARPGQEPGLYFSPKAMT